MDKIQEKLLNMENIVRQEVKKEANELNKAINQEIEDRINSIKNENEKIRNEKFYNSVKTLEQQVNKQIFEKETSYKTRVLNKKMENVEIIINGVLNKINEFIANHEPLQSEYREYLLKNITDATTNINNNPITIYITQNDNDRFLTDIQEKFPNANIQINNDIIGGCIIEYGTIFIDNSIKSKINEQKERLAELM